MNPRVFSSRGFTFSFYGFDFSFCRFGFSCCRFSGRPSVSRFDLQSNCVTNSVYNFGDQVNLTQAACPAFWIIHVEVEPDAAIAVGQVKSYVAPVPLAIRIVIGDSSSVFDNADYEGRQFRVFR